MKDMGAIRHNMRDTSYRQRIMRVLLHMEECINSPLAPEDDPATANALSLETLAGVAHLSPFHFHRVFTGMVGESVKAYIRRLRLERASTMLAFTERPVLEVALDSGYESQEAFTRAFKARFGSSPAQYRKEGSRLSPSNPYLKEYFMPDNSQFNPELLGLTVEIRQIPALRVAAVRHVGPYTDCGKAWKPLCDWAGSKGLFTENTLFCGICHDDPAVTDPAKIRYDACCSVPEGAVIDGPATEMTIRAGEYVTVLYKGPYEYLYRVYAAVYGQWIPSSGREMAMEPSVEVYLNSHENTAPEDLLTEIRIPLI
ncbi:AraC family transcriptional regulator [Desulfovibrio subterraneus]|uniref:AraC family transcriptional regulator n=1 Tax=Desulfovibrio subterraneus TaxID=2718620 RepID=UPI0022B8D6BE|nr:AraC family transcriptional regulator [Desulfovibrio subterraneus]WBF66385.1 AraC family transcriptional regulator [Desulfovibrio subterraneus]